MLRIALLLPLVLLTLFATPFDSSAEKASRGSLSWFAAALGGRAAQDGAPVGSANAPAVASSNGESADVTSSGRGQVTLHIVMPADAPTPGDEVCDPSYPQLCIPHDAEDLDCHEMGVAGFEVLAPDRHALDDDGDGLGCEA